MDLPCSVWRDAISARVDGEDPGVDPTALDAHVRSCPSCRAFEGSITRVRRRSLVREATPMPDLSRRVAKLSAVADRASRWSIVRALLAVVAIEVIAFAAPELVLGRGDASAHSARHIGAFSVAYGIALLVVVVRPARARTVLPVAGFLAGALVITAVIDLLNGTAPWNGEVGHLPEVVSVVLVWLLAVPAPRRRRRVATDDLRPTGLRVVRDADDRAS
jgi:predicted anti-sigma-YlaC factor YlaD